MMVSMIDSFGKLQSAFLIKIWLQKQSNQELPDWVVCPLSFVFDYFGQLNDLLSV